MAGSTLSRGTLVGDRYELVEFLGEGGNGEVWRALDKTSGRMVAVKAFKEKTDPNHRTKLLRELFMQARFAEHGNVLRLIEPLEEAGKLFLVIELADGGSAYDAIKSYPGGLPQETVLAIVRQIAEALAYIHERGGIHGDVKPLNILCVDGAWKLADMGTTKVVELTSGRVTGDVSVAYAAPEMFSSKIYAQSDVYSLGASAFELLTGRLPFAGLPPAIIAGHLFTEPTIPETLPTSWQEVLRRCLIKDHSQRWSAKELVDNLKSQFTGNLFVEPATGMRFLWVPGGRFQIGADNIQFPSAFDPRWVDVSPFWMAETPVTNEQYRRFVEAERHSEPGYWNNDRFNAPSQPVVSVRWNDAVAFCRWLTKQNGFEVRLPSEIEWEFAARGTDGRKYPWGNEEPDDTRACFNQDWNIGRPAAVGSYPAGRGPFGHLDLAGNVWEWCQEDVTKDFRQSDIVRALRGGSWFDDPRSLLSAYRSRLPAGLRFRSVGFRVAAASTVEH